MDFAFKNHGSDSQITKIQENYQTYKEMKGICEYDGYFYVSTCKVFFPDINI